VGRIRADDLILTTNGELKGNQILDEDAISYTMVKCHRLSLIPKIQPIDPTRNNFCYCGAKAKWTVSLRLGGAQIRPSFRHEDLCKELAEIEVAIASELEAKFKNKEAEAEILGDQEKRSTEEQRQRSELEEHKKSVEEAAKRIKFD
jgi:hypothetical protein